MNQPQGVVGGVKMWIGNKQVCQYLTKEFLERSFSPRSGLVDAAQLCLTELGMAGIIADDQPWIYYEHGVTIIPEWAEVEYRYESYNLTKCSSEFHVRKDIPSTLNPGVIRAYRLTGIKEGQCL